MRYKNIHSFLSGYADNVIFCYGNNAVTDMVQAFMRSAGDIPVVLFALDEKIAAALDGICDVVEYFDSDVEDKFYDYGTEEYKKIAWHGWFIGHEILKSGRSYIYMDVDIMIRRDFTDDILSRSAECVIQKYLIGHPPNAIGQGCAGFYFMRPTERTLSLTPEFFESHDYLRYKDDQDFFNSVILNSGMDIELLDMGEYPVGAYFYSNPDIHDTCYIAHFNCIVGRKAKIAAMVKYGFIDDN